MSEPAEKLSGTADAPRKVLIRKGRLPYVTDVPHHLVHDPESHADYVLVTTLTGHIVFAAPRSDVRG